MTEPVPAVAISLSRQAPPDTAEVYGFRGHHGAGERILRA
jgi:hypothetical protein